MTPDRVACDQDLRERVATDLRTTYLLEAGAGTGKTSVLVERYVSCLLDPERGTRDVRRIAAITFTEKAAGELRQRIREILETRARAAGDSPDAAVIQTALDALDDAPIGTIHGFAARLLREFPVEAGIDPAFEQLDEIGSQIERGRLWDEWLGLLAHDDGGARDAAPDRAPRRALSRLLRAGVKLRAVRELAIGRQGAFGERYDLDPAVAPPEPELRVHDLSGPLDDLEAFCRQACTDPDDKGCCTALALTAGCRALLAAPPADVDRLAAALWELPVRPSRSPGGAGRNWDPGRGGKDELQARYAALADAVLALRERHAAYVADLAAFVVDSFSRWAGGVQLGLGRLDFTDLLGRLRDLLLGDLAARGALQERFSFLLVDEFQDTDPLQSEIVFFLCEPRPRAAVWRDVVLQPGKLFVVGDPKQSIYRFRRADIALYDEVKRRIAEQPGGAGRVECIVQNFRTTASLVGWVNDVLAGVFDGDHEEGRQPRYQAVEPFRPAAGEPRLGVLVGREYGSAAGEAAAARRDEAGAVAALLGRMHGDDASQWQVQDRDAADPEALRPMRWGDVALLFRATTGLETYEHALREAGVPYRLEGGKTYFGRREIDDALVCLRAVDDPSDGPALYAALHSSFFGFSDDDLVAYWGAGGRFDIFAPGRPDGDPVVAALAVLHDLHERRAEREPHELITDLVTATHAAEVLAASGLGAEQATANLDKLTERARAFTQAGGNGLGAFLAWAAEAGEAASEQESYVDDDGDVVHLLTVHKAKGLEFPIVLLVGGAQGGGRRGDNGPLIDREARRLVVSLKAELPGVGGRSLEPQRYADLKAREKAMDTSERIRLLYVAATRARDRLVVTRFGRLTNRDGEPVAGALLGPVASALPAPADTGPPARDDVVVLPPPTPAVVVAPLPATAAPAAEIARRAWVAARADLLAAAARPAPATSPSGLEQVDQGLADDAAPPIGRGRALALGSVVHRILERCDLTDPAPIAGLAAVAAAELGHPGVADEAAQLARACWSAAPVRAAAAAAALDPQAVHRELTLGGLVDGVVVSGAADLVYRDGDAWVIVDFKTDRDADDELVRHRYGPQGGAYGILLAAATGAPVRAVSFVVARDGGRVVTVPFDDRLESLAREQVRVAAAAGRALAPDDLEA